MNWQPNCAMKSNAERKKATDTLFFAPDIAVNPQLPESESMHAVKVLRLKSGDCIDATDGKGCFYHCEIIQPHPKKCVVNILNRVKHPKSWNYQLQIAFAPTKSNDRIEWFAEKATEIGIDLFLPISCRFSERKELKSERIERVVIAAMKQSRQATVPLINKIITFEQFVKQPFEGQKFIAHCHKTEKEKLTNIYSKGGNALIAIGPEGDFSEQEVQLAIEYGFKPISLGSNRLRTETACLMACHTIHVLNDLI